MSFTQHFKLLVEIFFAFCDHYKKSMFIKFIIFKMVRERKTERERDHQKRDRDKKRDRETKRDREVYFLR